MTLRAKTLADLIAAELLGKTFAGVELSGDSTPIVRTHVSRKLVDDDEETAGVRVSVVPRGKEKTKGGRRSCDEETTVAVVVQKKLDAAGDREAQTFALAELVEAIDDHLTGVAPALGDFVWAESDINPFWNLDDVLTRATFTGIAEEIYKGDVDDPDDD